MAKRKRNQNLTAASAPVEEPISAPKKTKTVNAPAQAKVSKAGAKSSSGKNITIQIITGSYDRILHGITATLPATETATFADTFLFTAHTS
ncbi:hypothetical protein V490_09121, partial [Pseudogymnoascus sp. VKM F-3557]